MDGSEIYEELTLSGQTKIYTTNKYDKFTTLSLVSESSGTVYFVSEEGAVFNLILNPKETSKIFTQILFNPIPNSTAAGNFITYDYYKRIPDLVHDGDVSIIPNPVFLNSYIRMRCYEYQNDANNMMIAKAVMESALNEMMANKNSRKFSGNLKIQRGQVRFV